MIQSSMQQLTWLESIQAATAARVGSGGAETYRARSHRVAVSRRASSWTGGQCELNSLPARDVIVLSIQISFSRAHMHEMPISYFLSTENQEQSPLPALTTEQGG